MDVYSLCQHFKFLHSWVNTIPGYYGVCRSDSGSSIGLFFFFFSNSLYPAPANPWWPHVKFHHKRKDSVIISPTSCFYLEKIISPRSIFVGFSKTFHSGQNCFLSLLSHTKGGTQLWYNEVIEDCRFFCGGCSWLGTNHLHLSSRWKQTRIWLFFIYRSSKLSAWCFFSASRFVQFQRWLPDLYQTYLPAADISFYPVMPGFLELILSKKHPKSLWHRRHISKEWATKQLVRAIFTFGCIWKNM